MQMKLWSDVWMPKSKNEMFWYASIVLERLCSNVMELSELINENDFDDEPPTLTPSFQFSHWYLIQKPDQMLSAAWSIETTEDGVVLI
ncbi:hypothetical protein EVAR_53350_1 [Eumeta japonica]|uniref:Uncharacterized protein n=1 Tax=Eumeta variegata TaxID=151549 RepID=A0A4C1YGI7_EUMVA|nr:hypothetical protein EVAR_53350_1 [Eumeta japonica]